MATRKIKELAAEVATILGERLVLECHPDESPFPDIEERVRILAPGILADLIREADLMELSEFKGIEGNPSIDKSGVVTLELPDDFLRLVSIRMSDWEWPVMTVTSPDSPIYEMQRSSWCGIRGNQQRPVAILCYEGEKRYLKLYSSNEGSSVELALYMPRPEVSADDSIAIPNMLAGPLIRQIAEAVSKCPIP